MPILGTSPDAIDLAEDRDRFKQLLDKLELTPAEERHRLFGRAGAAVAADLGYPIVIRPSYVLGGRAMEIVHDEAQLDDYLLGTLPELVPHDVKARYPNDKTGQINTVLGKNPLLIDRYLSRRHRGRRRLPRRRQGHLHRRHHGAHRGGRHPFRRLAPARCRRTRSRPRRSPSSSGRRARSRSRCNVGGLMNVQYAIKDGDIYVLEVNPRASRTVPFVAKAIGLPVAKIAARVMAGEPLASFDLQAAPQFDHVGVKEAVFPFARFPGVDTVLGPEMNSTGEVMGLDQSLRVAFAKSQLGGGARLPRAGHRVRLGARRRQAAHPRGRADSWPRSASRCIATGGTQRFLAEHGVAADKINKVLEGRPHIVDAIKNGEVQLVFNTTEGATGAGRQRSAAPRRPLA